MKWVGWGLGILVLAITVLETHGFLALKSWPERTRRLTTSKKALDVALSFLIPTAILIVIYTQVKGFYGYRFNLATNLAYFRFGLPDVFILMLVGIFPDYIQGLIKIILWRRCTGHTPLSNRATQGSH